MMFCSKYLMVLKCKIVGGLLQYICKSTGSFMQDDKLHVGNHVSTEVVSFLCTQIKTLQENGPVAMVGEQL